MNITREYLAKMTHPFDALEAELASDNPLRAANAVNAINAAYEAAYQAAQAANAVNAINAAYEAAYQAAQAAKAGKDN